MKRAPVTTVGAAVVTPIEPRRSYAVAVRILEGERLRWVTDARHVVLTQGAPDHFESILRQVQ